jgi:hypothetical protein
MQQDEDAHHPDTPAATSAVGQTRDSGDSAPESPRDGRALEPALPAHEDANFLLGDGVARAALGRSYERRHDDPIYRPLKIFTVDPSLRRLEGATAVINVPYEPLERGPAGARFVVEKIENPPLKDYEPVDLEDRRILIRNGRDPAPSDPAFHHQMVYAVCCSVYAAFRAALGRDLAWGFDQPVLKIQPHGLPQANAEYSPDGYLKFGWFRPEDEKSLSRGYVFSCLSHDIIAHELTHALLDGLRAEFNKGSGVDVDAFHEAFADLVALFQRFSYREVVKSALRRTGGRLTGDSLLSQFAREFAQASGSGQSLRRVHLDENADAPEAAAVGTAKRDDGTPSKTYVPELGQGLDDRYERGGVLVSAVFEAFATVYRRKSAPYFRLATQGTGIFPPGTELPHELLEVLAHTASRLASHFLSICIRAIDYCPPVDLEFGEYLRALITADYNLVPDDPWAYREALIEAFARRRIFARNVETMSEDALLWRPPPKNLRVPRLSFARLRFSGDPGSPAGRNELLRQARSLGSFIGNPENIRSFGCAVPGDPALDGDEVKPPRIESVRSSRRVGPDGQMLFDLVAEVTQCRKVRAVREIPRSTSTADPR